MKAIKMVSLGVALSLSAFGQAQAANFCIAVLGGFGNGGATFVSKNFSLPANGTCSPWNGFTKTATTVIATSTGTGCRSSDGKVFTLSVFSTDPAFFGIGTAASDQLSFCPGGSSGCPIGSGSSSGSFGTGTVKAVSCTTSLLTLPSVHD